MLRLGAILLLIAIMFFNSCSVNKESSEVNRLDTKAKELGFSRADSLPDNFEFKKFKNEEEALEFLSQIQRSSSVGRVIYDTIYANKGSIVIRKKIDSLFIDKKLDEVTVRIDTILIAKDKI